MVSPCWLSQQPAGALFHQSTFLALLLSRTVRLPSSQAKTTEMEISLLLYGHFSLLLTPDRSNGIGPLDRLTPKNLPCEGSRGISTRNACFLGPEVKHEVEIAIPIHIFKMAHSVSFYRPVGSKLDTDSVYGGGTKIQRLPLCSASRQNGHRDRPFALQVDGVGEAARLDVNVNRNYGRNIIKYGSDIIHDHVANGCCSTRTKCNELRCMTSCTERTNSRKKRS